MENASPVIKEKLEKHVNLNYRNGLVTNVQPDVVFELIRNIKDPEHPYTLEQLNVVSLEDIFVGKIDENEPCIQDEESDEHLDAPLCKVGLPINYIHVIFTPTVPHCSMAGIIGLCIRRRIEKVCGGYWIKISCR